MLNPCATPSPAAWIVNSVVEWYDLAVLGPAGFDAYARLRFMPDPGGDDDDTDDQPDGPANGQANVGSLDEAWERGPRAYRITAIPGFPNLFTVLGPNSPTGSISLQYSAELTAGYITRWLERVSHQRMC